MPHLVAPSFSLEREFLALYSDYQKRGELEWCEAAKGALNSFPDYVRALEAESKGEGFSDDWAPTSHFWLRCGRRLVGTLRIRHYLTPAVEERAGHIGYDIAPSFRGRGYGHTILALGLKEARKLRIRDVMAICDEKNHASRQILEKAGGVITKEKGGEIWFVFAGADSEAI